MDMMSPIAGVGAPRSGSAVVASQDGTTLDSDFETFLTMLTAQMQNQDPLNPVDSTEFASQLAAFSTVEQQVKTNDLLTGLGRQMGVLGMTQMQGWIGMMAQAEMPVSFDGTPVELTVKTEPGTDLARLVVRDSRGAIVQELDAPPGGGGLQWTGMNAAGDRLPVGTYAISVDSFQGQALLGSTAALSRARVIEARVSDGATVLVMEGGQQVQAVDVLGLRAAPGPDS